MAEKPSTPAHGTRKRHRLGCRCVACTRSNYRRGEQPADLRWPARYVMNRHDEELVLDMIKSSLEDPQPIEFYKENGFGDFEADRLAIRLGDHPMMIWPGWIEAYE